LCLNDFDDTTADGAKRIYFAPPTSFFLAHAEKAFRALLHPDYHLRVFGAGKARLYGDVRGISRATSDVGAKFAVLVIPVFDDRRVHLSRYRYKVIHRDIARELSRADIVVYDMLNKFAERCGSTDCAID